MQDYRFIQAAVDELARQCAGLDEADVRNIREHVRAGEAELGFDTLCVVVDDKEIPISREFYDRVLAAAELMKWQDMSIIDDMERLVTP